MNDSESLISFCNICGLVPPFKLKYMAKDFCLVFVTSRRQRAKEIGSVDPDEPVNDLYK